MNRIETFENAEAAAKAAARAIAEALTDPGPRTFVATGGRTPWPAYDDLSGADLAWDEITVTQTDERFVDPRSDDSNARLIRARLLTGEAARARFIPLKGDGPTPEADAKAAEAKLAPLFPAAATLLGMGDDGHIGSMFPIDPRLPEWLDPEGERLVIGVETSGEKPYVPRISLTVRALLSTGLLAILITGEAKRQVMERALSGDRSLPVAAVVRQAKTPVRIFWAP
ncbi:MAG TPA: 6-phosphogluconolactonase [Caulobacteraceae bacterium]|jgi:6-phosphogluconolactonase|nr:6-phosphogluconolactonase [Caulobacteraceae bacterium]